MSNYKTSKNLTVLKDTTKTGKDRKWCERKLDNIQLGNDLQQLGYKTYNNVLSCSETLIFGLTQENTLRLKQSWFCKNKLCPICNWRRSMKYSYQIEQVLNQALKQEKGQFLFLTLTLKNVKGKDLHDECKKINKAFHLLMRYKKVKRSVIGYVKALEVTYNEKRNDYHPHLHVLLMVNYDYFRNKNNYIKQSEWIKLWQKATKVDYEPNVDIRKAKPKLKNQSLKSAILETAKYPVKPLKTMTTDENRLQVVEDLFNGLYRIRQLSFGGLFKEVHKKLHLDDIEDGDLINTNDENLSKFDETKEIVAVWNWQRKNYYIN